MGLVAHILDSAKKNAPTFVLYFMKKEICRAQSVGHIDGKTVVYNAVILPGRVIGQFDEVALFVGDVEVRRSAVTPDRKNQDDSVLMSWKVTVNGTN